MLELVISLLVLEAGVYLGLLIRKEAFEHKERIAILDAQTPPSQWLDE